MNKYVSKLKFTATAIALGFAFVWAKNIYPQTNDSTAIKALKAIIEIFSSTALAAIIVGQLWEWTAKADFADEIAEKLRLNNAMQASGVRHTTLDFNGDIEWKNLFEAKQQIDITVIYAQTWFTTHQNNIAKAIQRKVPIRVLLPNPNNTELMKYYASRFPDSTEQTVAAKINTTIAELKKLSKSGPRKTLLTIMLHDRHLTHCRYRFDEDVIITLYRLSPGRGPTPCFLLRRGGTLTKHFDDEFDEMWKSAKALDASQQRPTHK